MSGSEPSAAVGTSGGSSAPSGALPTLHTVAAIALARVLGNDICAGSRRYRSRHRRWSSALRGADQIGDAQRAAGAAARPQQRRPSCKQRHAALGVTLGPRRRGRRRAAATCASRRSVSGSSTVAACASARASSARAGSGSPAASSASAAQASSSGGAAAGAAAICRRSEVRAGEGCVRASASANSFQNQGVTSAESCGASSAKPASSPCASRASANPSAASG